MSPAFFRPMNVRKMPMPAAVPILSSEGIALAIVSRIGVTEISRNSTPAQKTMPSATCHQTFCVRMIVNVKKALMPMPGATANGKLRVDAHQQRHREADQDRGGQRAAECDAGAGCRENRGVHDHDVSHREEGGDAGDCFGANAWGSRRG